MKNQIYLSILLIFSIFFSTFIWNYINLNITHIDIVGEYLNNQHNALNDPLRYIFFVFLPLIFYLLFKFFFEKKKIKLENIRIIDQQFQSSKYLYYLNFIIFFFLFLEFLSLDFPLNKLDIFHEGQKLSAPFKNLIDNKLWSGAYVTTGIINESLGIKFIWKLFNYQSIGSMRFLQMVYIFLFKLSLIYLIYLISQNISFNKKSKLFFYLSLVVISLYLIDYEVASADTFSYRDLPIILCLICFFKDFNKNKNFNLNLVLIGLLSVLSFFWSIDRAINVNFLIIFICLFFIINHQPKKIISILFSLIFFWIIFFSYLDNEFVIFIENTLSVLKIQNYVHGIIHPQPFSDMPNSARATRSLLLIIFSLLISLSFFFSNKQKYNNNFKIIIITLSFVGFCSYLYALGRSDGGHIKQTTGILIILFSALIFFNTLVFLKNFLDSNFSHLITVILSLIFILNLNINFNKIIEFSKRLSIYVFLDDNEFLNDNQKYMIKKLKPYLEDYQCVQLFTNDAALPYLLKKQNCTKYYFIYSLGSIELQKKMINEMNNVKIVIYDGETDNWGISPKEKLPVVNDFIIKNFSNTFKVSDWTIRYK